jgi:hypothetical protein
MVNADRAVFDIQDRMTDKVPESGGSDSDNQKPQDLDFPKPKPRANSEEDEVQINGVAPNLRGPSKK